MGDVDEAELQRLRDRLSRLAGEDEGHPSSGPCHIARWMILRLGGLHYLAADGEFGIKSDCRGGSAAVDGERPEVAGRGPLVDEQERLWDSITRAAGRRSRAVSNSTA
ncbi:hypothetical protein [Saccharopolyspora spinosa]|uniref:hypothetical protein n=1 Tax=Saccharopolyspora spinosa TaxID=60894 RepID=UPI00376F2D00